MYKSVSRTTRRRFRNEIACNEESMRQIKKKPLSSDLPTKVHAYWRAANYLSVGRMYLYDNLLLISEGTLKMAQKSLTCG
jgi:phosphoketolase